MGISSKKRKGGPISDINVTPLVDVMLVLLVIFMITAPLILNGIKMELPKTKEVNRINLNKQQVVLSMLQGDEFYINKTRVLFGEILTEIKANFEKNKLEVLYFRAESKLQYGEVAKMISYLKRGGISNIALITEMEDKKE